MVSRWHVQILRVPYWKSLWNFKEISLVFHKISTETFTSTGISLEPKPIGGNVFLLFQCHWNHSRIPMSIFQWQWNSNEGLKGFRLIVLGFNDTSTLEGHFVSSPREREKRDRRESRGDEREGQGRKRNRNESEETEEIKTFPPLPLPTTRIAGLAQL